MRIVIPTRGRIEKQLTLTYLPKELQKQTDLVCPRREAPALQSLFPLVNVVIQPDDNMTITKKRAWIMKEWEQKGYSKLMMFDDDLRFAARIDSSSTKLKDLSAAEVLPYFYTVIEKLSPKYPHVGFGQRQGNNTRAEGWQDIARMTYSLGYYLPIVNKECELGRIETREDMDITLQLLRKGYPNSVFHTCVVDQRRYGSSGGCEGQRTIEKSNEDAKRLAELHPGFVKPVDKEYGTSSRTEVICYWQKAFQNSKKV